MRQPGAGTRGDNFMPEEASQETATTENVEAPEVTAGDADQVADTTTDTTETAPAETGDTTEADKDTEKVETFDRAYVEKLRRNEQKLRAKAKEDAEKAATEAAEASRKELAEQIGKALGLIKDDEPVDPAVLLEQAAEREAQIANERDAIAAKLRAYELDKALTKAASAVDGDLDILTPYLKGTGALDALDPDAADYADQVSAVVAAAVEANPKLKKVAPVAAPSRSGGDITNGTGIPKKGPKSVEDFLREDLEKVTRKR